MRRRQLKWLWARLKQVSMMTLSREDLLMKLGAARAHAPAAWRLVVIAVAPEGVTFTSAATGAPARAGRADLGARSLHDRRSGSSMDGPGNREARRYRRSWASSGRLA